MCAKGSIVILSNGPEIPWLCHGMTIQRFYDMGK